MVCYVLKNNRISVFRPRSYYLMQKKYDFQELSEKTACHSGNNKCYWKTVSFVLSVTKWKAHHGSSSGLNQIVPLTLLNNLGT